MSMDVKVVQKMIFRSKEEQWVWKRMDIFQRY